MGLLVGQSYVALSRASSVDGLQVLGFDPKKVRYLTFRLRTGDIVQSMCSRPKLNGAA